MIEQKEYFINKLKSRLINYSINHDDDLNKIEIISNDFNSCCFLNFHTDKILRIDKIKFSCYFVHFNLKSQDNFIEKTTNAIDSIIPTVKKAIKGQITYKVSKKFYYENNLIKFKEGK